MHAFLLIGNNSEQEILARISAWKISLWDTIRVAGEGTIGIELIRDFEHELSLSPRNSPAKVGVLTDMERLTVEAQNALLKTLEEPPPLTYIIGTTNNPEALLPTIRSRMSVILLKDTSRPADASILHELLRQPIGKRLEMMDAYTATRDDAKNFISMLTNAAHQELHKQPTPQLTALIRNLFTASSQLSVNVNQKLVVDNAIIHIG
jgi:DNA polymerase III delta prime subunit